MYSRSLHMPWARVFSHGSLQLGICWLRQQRRLPLDVVQCNEVLRSFAQGAAREGMIMKNLTDNQPVWLKTQTPRLPNISWGLVFDRYVLGGPNTSSPGILEAYGTPVDKGDEHFPPQTETDSQFTWNFQIPRRSASFCAYMELGFPQSVWIYRYIYSNIKTAVMTGDDIRHCSLRGPFFWLTCVTWVETTTLKLFGFQQCWNGQTNPRPFKPAG